MALKQDLYYAYKPKEVVTQASDVLVYINGVDEFYICNGAGGKSRFTDAVMSVSTTLATDSSPGSASITLAVPRHSNSAYFKYGKCVFKPMMEVQIYFKGRYLDSNQRAVYYPAFWGVITAVNAPYSSGENTITISCKDILYFWAITRIGTNPSVFQQVWDNKLKIQEYVSIFNHMSPYQIMIAIARVLHGSLIPPQNFPKFGEGSSQISFATFGEENAALTDYWRTRQLAIGNRLRIFGAAPGSGEGSISGTVTSLPNEKIDEVAKQFDYLRTGAIPTKKPSPKEMQSLFTTSETVFSEPFALDGRLMDHFQPYNQANQVSDFASGETMSRLEIASQVKEFIDYEFFMDTTGELVFKPPFYNLDVREHDPVSIIRDIDIISEDVGENVEEILTRLDVKGTYSSYYESGDPAQIPWGSYIDYKLAKDFGQKFSEVTRSFLHTSEMCTLYAIAELSRFNAKRFSGTMEIIGRPELRLGYPVYVESKDTFYYVTGIAHTYSSNGVLKTTLTLEGARRKYTSRDPDKKEGYSWDLSDPFRPRQKGIANVVLTMDIPKKILEAKPVKPGALKTEVKKEDTTNTVKTEAEKRLDPNAATKQNSVPQTPKKDNKPGGKTEKIQNTPAFQFDPTLLALIPGANILSTIQQAQEAANAANKKEEVNVDEAIKDPKTLLLPEFSIYRSPNTELIDRVMEGAVGIKFQAWGRPKEIIQKGVYVANLRQIPVSDEFGYELIGGFGYGRGTKLNKDGLLRTYLPSSEAIKLTDAQLESLKKKGIKDYASVIYRINGTPNLTVPKKGETYDRKRKDYVSALTGVTTGEFRYRNVGKYLVDMGNELDHKITQMEMMECKLAETDGAVLEMLDAKADAANNHAFKAEFYGMLADRVPTTSVLGEEVLPGIKKEVDSKVLSPDGGDNGIQPSGAAPPPPTGSWGHPCPSAPILTCSFRSARRPNHQGIDLAGGDQDRQAKILASENGRVTHAGWAGGYGYAVYIDHGNGYQSRYAHGYPGSIRVKVGAVVTKGTHLMGMGNTGHSGGNHLHFEIRLHGSPIDPKPLIGYAGRRGLFD